MDSKISEWVDHQISGAEKNIARLQRAEVELQEELVHIRAQKHEASHRYTMLKAAQAFTLEGCHADAEAVLDHDEEFNLHRGTPSPALAARYAMAQARKRAIDLHHAADSDPAAVAAAWAESDAHRAVWLEERVP